MKECNYNCTHIALHYLFVVCVLMQANECVRVCAYVCEHGRAYVSVCVCVCVCVWTHYANQSTEKMKQMTELHVCFIILQP